MGRPISYEMQMMFVGSSGAFEEAMNTGSGISRLDFIQGYDFSFNIERTPLKQIGSDSFATRQTQLAPDVNLNIQYYLNDGWNDKYIGLDIPTGATGNPFDSILSSTGDRNFYISIAQNDGIDQNLQTGIVNSNILAIGNAYITNYEISVAVNQLATVSCSFVGANANVQDYATSKYLPSVNTLVSGQNAQDANKNFSLNFVNNSRTERYLPKAKEVFDGGCPYSKCKITPDFQSGGGTSPITFGFFDAIANNFQSMQFSVQFERKSLYGFGNNHPYIRKIQRPTVATLSLSALIDDFQAENLSKVFHAEGGTQKSMLIEFFNFQDVKKFGLSLQNLTLESYNLGARIGDRVLVETNWTVEVKNGAGGDIGMIGSYGVPALDVTLVNESFAVERLFYEMAGGQVNSYGLDKNGKIWAWGNNSIYNYIGRTDSSTFSPFYKTPVTISGANKTFCHIQAGDTHILALDKKGQIWGWGYGRYGQLANPAATTYRTPVKIMGEPKTFCQIVSRRPSSFAIDKYGLAWAWGLNSYGGLGINNNATVCVMTPVLLAGNKTFCQIRSSTEGGAAIDKNGKIWVWGRNAYGELGDGTAVSKISPVAIAGSVKTFCQISAGDYYCLALDKYGRAWSWGYNLRGQLGNNSTTSQLTPVSVCGTLKTFCKITTGSESSYAIDKYGKIWAWGGNLYGQLGDGSIISRSTPVAVCGTAKTFCDIITGYYHCLATDKNGRAWAWGWNTYGQFGNGTNSRLPNLLDAAYATFCKIYAGQTHSLAIDKNGMVWSWGTSSGGANGVFGDGSLVLSRRSPVSVIGNLKTFCQISAGNAFSTALDVNGKIWTWGLGIGGRLGNGDLSLRCTPTAIGGNNKTFCEINSGLSTTLAIDKYGRAWGWGYNTSGRIGDGSLTSKLTPVRVYGDRTFCKISTGSTHSAGIDNYGMAWSWGSNLSSQLGNNSSVASELTPVRVYGNRSFCKITVGGSNTLAIDIYGKLWSWGAGFRGAIGNDSTSNQSTPVNICGDKIFINIHTINSQCAATDENGIIWAWGNNQYGQLGDGTIICRSRPNAVTDSTKTFCSVSGGNEFTIALDKTGKVWAWGRGEIFYFDMKGTKTPVRVYNI